MGSGAVAEHHRGALLGLEQPLVRREAHRIGALDAGEQVRVALAEAKRAGPGGVHVAPGGIGIRIERIDRAGGDCSRGEHERGAAGVELGDPQAMVVPTGGQLDQLEAQEGGCLADAEMSQLGGHDGAHVAQLARRPQGRERGQARARQQVAAVHAEERREPAHHRALELARHRRGIVMKEVLVEGGGPQRAGP